MTRSVTPPGSCWTGGSPTSRHGKANRAETPATTAGSATGERRSGRTRTGRLPRHWSSLPGGVLVSTDHVDTLAELTRERQAEFEVIVAAIETAIVSLGAAARVHVYRWGDGRAHFRPCHRPADAPTPVRRAQPGVPRGPAPTPGQRSCRLTRHHWPHRTDLVGTREEDHDRSQRPGPARPAPAPGQVRCGQPSRSSTCAGMWARSAIRARRRWSRPLPRC